MRLRITKLASSPGVWLTAIVLGLMLVGHIMGQLQPSGNNVTVIGTVTENLNQVAGVGVATAAAGIQKVGVTDGTGTAITSTGSALDINIKTGSIGNTAFGISAGTSLIGTTLPKTGCGTTVYDSGPTNLPAALGVLTSTATCVEAVYCKNLDAAAVHPITVTDQSAACNAGTCNLIPPAYSLTALGDVRFPLGYVKAVGGIKWNTDAVNKVTCFVEGLQ